MNIKKYTEWTDGDMTHKSGSLEEGRYWLKKHIVDSSWSLKMSSQIYLNTYKVMFTSGLCVRQLFPNTIRAEEMAQWLIMAFLVGDPSLVPRTHVAAHKWWITLVPRGPVSFSGLQGHCTYIVQRHIWRQILFLIKINKSCKKFYHLVML